jgi:hypothetical protein
VPIADAAARQVAAGRGRRAYRTGRGFSVYLVWMLASTTAATPWGVEARPVQVEVDVHHGLPQVHIVGLADAAVRESRERVRTAIRNCGFHL